MQIEIIYPATFLMIFLDFVFRRNKWSKVIFFFEKDDLSPNEIFLWKEFLWKEGRSFETWEDENNWAASKPCFREMILRWPNTVLARAFANAN